MIPGFSLPGNCLLLFLEIFIILGFYTKGLVLYTHSLPLLQISTLVYIRTLDSEAGARWLE